MILAMLKWKQYSVIKPLFQQPALLLHHYDLLGFFGDRVLGLIGSRPGHIQMLHNGILLVSKAVSIVNDKHMVKLVLVLPLILLLYLWFLLLAVHDICDYSMQIFIAQLFLNRLVLLYKFSRLLDWLFVVLSRSQFANLGLFLAVYTLASLILEDGRRFEPLLGFFGELGLLALAGEEEVVADFVIWGREGVVAGGRVVQGDSGFVEGVAAVVLGFEDNRRLIVLVLVEIMKHVFSLLGDHEAVLLLHAGIRVDNATAI